MLKETTSNIACSLQQATQPKGTGPCQEQQINPFNNLGECF